MVDHRPHPANTPGDFYVEEGCCTLCEVPLLAAPGLFGWWPDASDPQHCYVKRQPGSPAELDGMISAICQAELECIRYRGSDRLIQERLVEAGEGTVCEGLPDDLRRRAERTGDRRRARWSSWWGRLWWRGGAG